MRLFSKDDVADRSDWKSGPWDSEPDYCEWITRAGYAAYMGRLESGAWAGAVIAPPPTGPDIQQMKFFLKLGDSDYEKYGTGHSSASDISGMLEYVSGTEHWECPGYSTRTLFRGPYKTMVDSKERLELLAEALLKLHNNPDLYKDF